MLFPTDEEKKALTKNLLPKAREMSIANELRGWNWHIPPLEPIYDTKLALYEVANYYCETSRDVYHKYVNNVKVKPNNAMLFGKILHSFLAKLIIDAKKIIYTSGVDKILDAFEQIRTPDYSFLDKLLEIEMPETEMNRLKEQISLVWRNQFNAIVSQVELALSKQPRISEDSLVSIALPITVEHNLNGSFLGLSSHLSTDAYHYFDTIVLDLKFGAKRDFHRLTTTGYALVMESLYEHPINLGCIVYVSFGEHRIFIERDYHLIDDELRQWFIEARDEKMRIVNEEIDPGKPGNCYRSCPYFDHC